VSVDWNGARVCYENLDIACQECAPLSSSLSHINTTTTSSHHHHQQPDKTEGNQTSSPPLPRGHHHQQLPQRQQNKQPIRFVREYDEMK